MRNVKKVTALIVACVMIMAMVMTASATPVFPDVDSNDQYAAAISLLKMLQVTTGDQNGNFNPNQTITRAEFSKILYVLMNGTPDVSLYAGKSSFSDVADNAWYSGYVNWASNQGVVSGKGNNKFAPLDPVTSQEASKMFVVALTGKSTLTWPYGFVTEASRTNINLYKGTVVKDLAKPATRNLIAQFCYNAIFAVDVANFYVRNTQGIVVEKPSAATAVFGLKNLSTVIYETSRENWSLTGIRTDNMIAVKNENGDIVQVAYSASTDNVGYSVSIYYQDNNRNNKLDSSNDTVLSVALGNSSAVTVKPINILSVNNTYQLGGITFNPNADIKSNAKLFVMSPSGVVTSSILTPAALTPYFGALSTDATTTSGPANDFDVKVVKDNASATINAVYITQPITFTRVISYNQTGGTISLDSALFGTKTIAAVGTAPNMTKVAVASSVKVNDYVSVFPSKDYSGITWKVNPLLVESGVTMTAIKSDGTPMFGNKTYTKNVQVNDAVASGRLPNTADVLTVGNLSKTFNVYLDTTGVNYLYALPSSAVTIENYAFVRAVNTVSSITGVATYTITVVDTNGVTKAYNLNLAAASEYLTGNASTGVQGWVSADGSYAKINILNKVVKLTINTSGEVSRLENMGGSSSTKLTYNASTKVFSDNSNTVGVVDEASVIYVWTSSTNTVAVYKMNNLPSFINATGTYLAASLKLKIALLTDLGSPTTVQTTTTSRGVVLGYSTLAGTTSGKVKYSISAIAKDSVPITLTTSDEMSGGSMGTALVQAQGGSRFVDFTLDSSNIVTAITATSVTSGTAITSGTAGWSVGTITAASGSLYAIKGINIAAGKLESYVGNAVTYTLGAGADIYTINAAPTGNALIPVSVASSYAVATSSSMSPVTPDIAYVIVYHTDANNTIDTAFVYNFILLQ